MDAPIDIQNTAQPVRNSSVRSYRVGNDTVFYDPVRDQVFAVNALTHEVWDRCNGTTSLKAIGQEMGQLYEVPPDSAVERVRQIATDLLRQQLLYASKETAETRESIEYVTYGDHQVEIRTDAPPVLQATRRLFRMMQGEGDKKTLDTLGVYGFGDGYNVQGSRVMHVQEGSLEDVMRSIKHEVVLRFVETRSDLIWLHAGAVAQGGSVLLFVGEWGSGKSTFVATLYREGWTYLSDDMIPYDPTTKCVLPFPLTMAYREHQGELLPKEAIPSLEKVYVDLEQNRVQGSPVPVQAVVFPTFQPDAAPGLDEYSAAKSAVALIRQCQNVNEYHGDAVQELCEMAHGVSSFRISYNNQSSIASLLKPIGASSEE